MMLMKSTLESRQNLVREVHRLLIRLGGFLVAVLVLGEVDKHLGGMR